MNSDEVKALVAGSLLKPSLEVYAPFDGQGGSGQTAVINFAQSANVVTVELFTPTALEIVKFAEGF